MSSTDEDCETQDYNVNILESRFEILILMSSYRLYTLSFQHDSLLPPPHHRHLQQFTQCPVLLLSQDANSLRLQPRATIAL